MYAERRASQLSFASCNAFVNVALSCGSSSISATNLTTSFSIAIILSLLGQNYGSTNKNERTTEAVLKVNRVLLKTDIYSINEEKQKSIYNHHKRDANVEYERFTHGYRTRIHPV